MQTITQYPTSILITDDHSIIRRTLREWLTSEFSGLTIHEACSGEQALELLETQTLPDLILMDFHLPGRSGITVMEEIKQTYPGIPVVMLTIQEDSQYISRALSAGADAYVIKRCMYTDLIPVILDLFARSTSELRQDV